MARKNLRMGRFAILTITIISLIALVEMALRAEVRVRTPMTAMQTTPGDWSLDAQRLTLVGSLVVAVGVLWKTLASERADKDARAVKYMETLVSVTKSVTDALTSSAASNGELRRVIEEDLETKRELSESISMLRSDIARMPCSAEDQKNDAKRFR